MNRFRTKKKAKEGKDTASTVGRPSQDSDVPPMPALKSSMTFRRGKKNTQEAPKPELDLANALPPSDDFRTSLLMSGLSARFSMLREQDDPNTKMGKASDDSVLSPKRQSRLIDFGFQSGGLADIAEVASIHDTIRRPFALERVDSYHSNDGYGTDEGGSIMSRAKPGEGNTLFGGRQKIYKIPIGGSSSTKNLGADGEPQGMGGRALYNDDVSQSAFQKLREKEREREQWEREQRDRDQQEEDEAQSGYNRNRETSSTTSEDPSLTRSSTAATSITSQRTPSDSTPSASVPNQSGSNGIERSLTKSKRLYETGSDQHLQNQQFSAISRLENLTRQRNLSTRSPSPSPVRHNGDNLHSQSSKPQSDQSSLFPAAAATLGAFNFGVKPVTSQEAAKPSYGISPPLSPPMSDGDDQSSITIQPSDRGKATALGSFTKPVQPYDENKYSQRQLQMQQGRATPPLRKHSPPRAFAPSQQVRPRADSSAHSNGRSRSSSSVGSRFKHHAHPTRNELPMSSNYATPSSGILPLSPPNEVETNTGRGIITGGKHWDRSAVLQTTQASAYITPERPLESDHPAHRQHSERLVVDYTLPMSDINDSVFVPTAAHVESGPSDSLNLGPVSGLNGLVRQHLRSDSTNSSVYGVPSTAPVSRLPSRPAPSSSQNDYDSNGNPWDINDWDDDQGNHESINRAPVSHVKPFVPHVRPGGPSQIPEPTRRAPWEKEVATHHSRDGSSETQKEREDFANELATRRRRVQQNLKSFVEADSRSTSPAPKSNWSRDPSTDRNPMIGMLKPKTSHGNLAGREGPSKATKMPGMANPSSPFTGTQRSDDNLWKQEEEEMLRGVNPSYRGPPQNAGFRQAHSDVQRDRERQAISRQQRGIGDFGDSDAPMNKQILQQAAAPMRQGVSPGDWKPPSALVHPLVVNRPPSSLERHNEPSRDYRSPSSLERHHEPSRDYRSPSSLERHQEPSRDYRSPSSLERHHEPSRGYRSPSEEIKRTGPNSRSGSQPPSRSARERSSSEASTSRSKSRNGRYRDDLAKAMADGIGSSAQSTLDDLASARMPMKPQGSPMIYQGPQKQVSTINNGSTRSRSNSRATPAGYFDNNPLKQPIRTDQQMEIGVSPRPSPVAPFSANTTPALANPSSAVSSTNAPTTQGSQPQGIVPAARKRSVNKSDISDPQLLSMTSRISTVTLPAAVEQQTQNGFMISAPPLPTMDPRRRQTRTQTIFGALKGKNNGPLPGSGGPAAMSMIPPGDPMEEYSTFSADEADVKPKQRQRLRKSSSEGGNLHARARQAQGLAPSPALPSGLPPAGDLPGLPTEGGMF